MEEQFRILLIDLVYVLASVVITIAIVAAKRYANLLSKQLGEADRKELDAVVTDAIHLVEQKSKSLGGPRRNDEKKAMAYGLVMANTDNKYAGHIVDDKIESVIHREKNTVATKG